MTQGTRNGLIGLLDLPAVAEIDQAVMDAYLSAYSSRENYEATAKNQTCFFAVLSTAEYHEHWNDPRYMFPSKLGGASTVTETPIACRHCGCLNCIGGCLAQSSAIAKETDSRFERVVK